MSRLMLGTLCGLVYGALSAASMLPLTFPDKRAALLGAFINRFSIGFVIGAVALPWPGWMSGLVIGLLLSLADAIIPKRTFRSSCSARLAEHLSAGLFSDSDTETVVNADLGHHRLSHAVSPGLEFVRRGNRSGRILCSVFSH
jgi:hypothetical protein